jgi:asparagine synthase (glutamine-hydrolysing)
MAHGIEGRFPFLDHRLVEFAARLSPETKLRGLREKHILREAAKGLLPPDIVQRQKQPYRAPDSRSFIDPSTGSAEHAYVAQAMSEREIAATGLFNTGAVSKLYRKCSTQNVEGFRDNAAFVGILSAQLWMRNFAAGRAAILPEDQPIASGDR